MWIQRWGRNGMGMTHLLRVSLLAIVAISLANCSTLELFETNAPSTPRLNGHVYLIRGLFGEVFSRGLDQLAETLNNRGVRASVHGLLEVNSLTEQIIQNYKKDPSSSPIILIGHSSGGDAIISMAQRMKIADVPVGLSFGFDPTPLASPVPTNVELFINLFQKSNPIGGGEVRAESGFPGRLINIDLREHNEIIHITLDKSSVIHQLVVDVILGFAAASTRNQLTALIDTSLKSKKQMPNPAIGNAVFANSLNIKYIVPRNEKIEFWDSALRITTRAGDSVQGIAAQYGAPAWAISEINKNMDPLIPAGTVLLIPKRQYSVESGATATQIPY
jgi:hypothetical protein